MSTLSSLPLSDPGVTLHAFSGYCRLAHLRLDFGRIHLPQGQLFRAIGCFRNQSVGRLAVLASVVIQNDRYCNVGGNMAARLCSSI